MFQEQTGKFANWSRNSLISVGNKISHSLIYRQDKNRENCQLASMYCKNCQFVTEKNWKIHHSVVGKYCKIRQSVMENIMKFIIRLQRKISKIFIWKRGNNRGFHQSVIRRNSKVCQSVIRRNSEIHQSVTEKISYSREKKNFNSPIGLRKKSGVSLICHVEKKKLAKFINRRKIATFFSWI